MVVLHNSTTMLFILFKPSAPKPALSRTSTGIISNRRPTATTPGSERPKESDDTSEYAANKHRPTLLAEAKRQAAHTRLYATFYRGLVIPPMDEQFETIKCEAERKTQEANFLTDRDTHLDSDTHIRGKKDKSSKQYKKSPDANVLEKENTLQTFEIPVSKKKKREARIEEGGTEDGLKRSKTKRRRDSVIEDRGSFNGKSQTDSKDAACDQEDQRKRKKVKKRKESEEDLLKQSDKVDTADMMHEEKKRKKKKRKDKRDENAQS